MSVTVDSEIRVGDLVRFSPSVVALLTEHEMKHLKGLEAIGLVIETFSETYGNSLEDHQQIDFATVLWPAGYTSRDFTVHLRRVDDETPACKNTLEDLGWHVSEETPTPRF